MNKPAQTRDFARSVAMGALNLTIFGAIWALAALGNWPPAPAWSFAAVALVAAILAVVSIGRLVAAGKLPATSVDQQDVQQEQRARTWFTVIFGVQALLIAVAVFGLVRLERPALIPVVVAVIVGLHFWPLARLFQTPLYWFTGVLLLLCAAASLLIEDTTLRLLALGLAAALVLWLSAALLLIGYTGHAARATPMPEA